MQAIYNQHRVGLLQAERCYLDPACDVSQTDAPDEVYLIRGTLEVLGDSEELEWVNAEKWMQETCACGEELYPEDAFLKHKNNDTCLGCAACVRTMPGEQYQAEYM